MSARHLIHTSIMAALLFSAGCATDISQSSREESSSTQVRFVTQDQARHLAFMHRRQASDIRELARRVELETQLATRHSSANQAESIRRLAQVKELLDAADEADELALDYGRRVPHGQVQ